MSFDNNKNSSSEHRIAFLIFFIILMVALFISFFIVGLWGEIKKPISNKDESPVEIEIPQKEIKQEVKNSNFIGDREITFYTSTPNQTDKTPCIGVSGDICLRWLKGESLCASNEFPLGTVLFIWGGIQQTCEVADRINPKYKDRIDIYLGFDKDCLDDYQPGDICPQLIEAQRRGIIIEQVEIW